MDERINEQVDRNKSRVEKENVSYKEILYSIWN